LTHPGNVLFIEIDFDQSPNPEDPLYPLSEQHAMHLGAGLSLIGSCQLSGKSGLEAEVGYKTAGFVPGESLFRAPIARVYYTLVF